MALSRPIRRNDGKVVGNYDSNTNEFIRNRKKADNLNWTHLGERDASTFDKYLIRDLEVAVVDYGNSLDTLVLIDDYKKFKRSITYKEFLEHTDNKKKLFLHRGENPDNHKQYEILIRHMKEANNG
jgi:hypothetical protein